MQLLYKASQYPLPVCPGLAAFSTWSITLYSRSVVASPASLFLSIAMHLCTLLRASCNNIAASWILCTVATVDVRMRTRRCGAQDRLVVLVIARDGVRRHSTRRIRCCWCPLDRQCTGHESHPRIRRSHGSHDSNLLPALVHKAAPASASILHASYREAVRVLCTFAQADQYAARLTAPVSLQDSESSSRPLVTRSTLPDSACSHFELKDGA